MSFTENKPFVEQGIHCHERWILGLIFVIQAFLLLNCTERQKNNPFDPDSAEPPLSLTLTPKPREVILHWNLKFSLRDFRGFRIYRGMDSPESLRRLLDLPAYLRAFSDTALGTGHWHFYEVTILGNNLESKPSNREKTLPGRGFPWTLSRFEPAVRKLSYDLIHPLRTFKLFDIPSDWSVSFPDSTIWISYNRFTRGISEVNMQNGLETLFRPENVFINPIAIEYTSKNQTAYVLDDARSTIILFQKNNPVIAEIPLDTTNTYIKLLLEAATDQAFILGNQSLFVRSVNPGSLFRRRIDFTDGYEGQDIQWTGNRLLALAASKTAQHSRIYTLDGNGTVLDSLTVAGFFYRLHFDTANEWFYLAEQVGSDRHFLVQLSSTGNRQFQLSGFGFIEEIGLNPYDRSVMALDPFVDLISLYDKQGNFISESRNGSGKIFLNFPTRLVIE